MNNPVQFDYTISFGTYRKMIYFNTFGIKPVQSIFMAVAWLAASFLFVLDTLKVIEPTRIMHMCFLIVTISIPMLIISLEMKIRQNKEADYFSKVRTVVLDGEGIGYYDEKKRISRDSWAGLSAVYETKSLFIIYKGRNIFPILKTGESQEKIEAARRYLQENLGSRFTG
jgi:hypothetical protein